jgi:2-polyprenyl-6-methoxyphenol hydroxylase-like FAD-dependent oxidoreductase
MEAEVMEILISGAGIAGPALAYWLGRYGFRPTIVETAPALRTGGSAVDFRGRLHLGVLSKMGVVDALRAVETHGTEMRFVDADGATLMTWPAGLAGGDLEVQRGDLSRILCEAAGDRTEYLFGDRIAALTDTPAGVEVTFAGGRQRRFDLVIGADGVHSAVRRLVFGPEEQFVKHLGYYVAGWDVPADLTEPGRIVMHNTPGRMAGAGGGAAFFCFRSPRLRYDRHDPAGPGRILRDRYAGMGWLTPRLLDHLDPAGDVYFDQICRVDNPHWTRGRVALVGDAACGATIGGQGNGTAVVSAYVLAGELAAAGGDHTAAFARYEQRIARFARRTQKGGDTTGMFLAPKTATGIRLRNALNNQQWFIDLTFKLAADRSTDLTLPAYEMAA